MNFSVCRTGCQSLQADSVPKPGRTDCQGPWTEAGKEPLANPIPQNLAKKCMGLKRRAVMKVARNRSVYQCGWFLSRTGRNEVPQTVSDLSNQPLPMKKRCCAG